MSQTQIMLQSEGNAWLERNRDKLGKVDHVSDILKEIGIVPHAVCEVGCSNGWRLAKLRDLYQCTTIGVEPSKHAIAEGYNRGIVIRYGTADALPTLSGWADVLIYGFCLYLAEPRDWFRVVAEGDRVLAYDGYLVIHDTCSGESVTTREYGHRSGITSYHFDFARLWLSSPAYNVICRRLLEDDQMVTILRKRRIA